MKRSNFSPTFMLFAAMAGIVPATYGQSRPGLHISLSDPGPIGAVTTTAIFSHFATGGGYTTVFTLLNTGTSTLDGSLIVTAQDGTPFNANLQSSAGSSVTASSIPVTLPMGGTAFITATAPATTDPTKVGWARVESSGGTLGGVSTFQFVSNGALQTIAGVLPADTVSSATIPVNDDVSANRFTGYAVANPSGSSITVKVVAVDTNGNPTATLTPISLGPRGQIAKFLFQDPNANPTFKGSIVLLGQGGATFTVVALVQVQGAAGPLFTVIPAIPGNAPNIN